MSACNGFEVKLVCCLNRYIKLSFCGTGGTTVDVNAELTVGGSVDLRKNDNTLLFVFTGRLC